MNPFSLTAPLTSAFEAAVIAVGTSGTCQPLPPSSYNIVPPALVGVPTATPSSTRLQAAKESASESESLPLTDRIGEHLSYLREVSRGEGSLISRHTAQQAAEAWLHCWEATGYALPVPAACTGPDGHMQYNWDRGEHHLELNISPTEVPSFFYRNRQTGELWMEDYVSGRPNLDVIAKLKLFV